MIWHAGLNSDTKFMSTLFCYGALADILREVSKDEITLGSGPVLDPVEQMEI